MEAHGQQMKEICTCAHFVRFLSLRIAEMEQALHYSLDVGVQPSFNALPCLPRRLLSLFRQQSASCMRLHSKWTRIQTTSPLSKPCACSVASSQRSRRVQKLQAKQVARIERITDVSRKVLGYVRVSTEEQASKGHGLVLRSAPSVPLSSRRALN